MGIYGGYIFSRIVELKNRFSATASFVYSKEAFTTYQNDYTTEQLNSYCQMMLNLKDEINSFYIMDNKLVIEMKNKDITFSSDLLSSFIKMLKSKFYPNKYISN